MEQDVGVDAFVGADGHWEIPDADLGRFDGSSELSPQLVFEDRTPCAPIDYRFRGATPDVPIGTVLWQVTLQVSGVAWPVIHPSGAVSILAGSTFHGDEDYELRTYTARGALIREHTHSLAFARGDFLPIISDGADDMLDPRLPSSDGEGGPLPSELLVPTGWRFMARQVTLNGIAIGSGPGWVAAWCASTRRMMRVYAVPPSGFDQPATPSEFPVSTSFFGSTDEGAWAVTEDWPATRLFLFDFDGVFRRLRLTTEAPARPVLGCGGLMGRSVVGRPYWRWEEEEPAQWFEGLPVPLSDCSVLAGDRRRYRDGRMLDHRSRPSLVPLRSGGRYVAVNEDGGSNLTIYDADEQVVFRRSYGAADFDGLDRLLAGRVRIAPNGVAFVILRDSRTVEIGLAAIFVGDAAGDTESVYGNERSWAGTSSIMPDEIEAYQRARGVYDGGVDAGVDDLGVDGSTPADSGPDSDGGTT